MQKAKWGDKIVIYGSLDVIDGLLKYDGEELDEYITERFGIYAPGGGFIFNGGHFIQPDIPPLRLEISAGGFAQPALHAYLVFVSFHAVFIRAPWVESAGPPRVST